MYYVWEINGETIISSKCRLVRYHILVAQVCVECKLPWLSPFSPLCFPAVRSLLPLCGTLAGHFLGRRCPRLQMAHLEPTSHRRC